jgi:dihydrofolate reductase
MGAGSKTVRENRIVDVMQARREFRGHPLHALTCIDGAAAIAAGSMAVVDHRGNRMGKVVLDVSLSLDGFSAGADVAKDQPMGAGGERLHAWMSGSKGADQTDVRIAGELAASSGAVITGRRTFDVGIDLWGDDGAFGMPCFVLTHHARERLTKGPTTFSFVTDGIRNCLDQARRAAGDKDVWLMGAADVAQQFLEAQLVDEIRIHLVPVLLRAGTRLFDRIDFSPATLQIVRVVESTDATHMTYRVVR